MAPSLMRPGLSSVSRRNFVAQLWLRDRRVGASERSRCPDRPQAARKGLVLTPASTGA